MLEKRILKVVKVLSSSHEEKERMRMSVNWIALQESVRFLSSGTLATLTGLRRYDDLYQIKEAFMSFCQPMPKDMSWVEAWELFKETCPNEDWEQWIDEE